MPNFWVSLLILVLEIDIDNKSFRCNEIIVICFPNLPYFSIHISISSLSGWMFCHVPHCWRRCHTVRKNLNLVYKSMFWINGNRALIFHLDVSWHGLSFWHQVFDLVTSTFDFWPMFWKLLTLNSGSGSRYHNQIICPWLFPKVDNAELRWQKVILNTILIC